METAASLGLPPFLIGAAITARRVGGRRGLAEASCRFGQRLRPRYPHSQDSSRRARGCRRRSAPFAGHAAIPARSAIDRWASAFCRCLLQPVRDSPSRCFSHSPLLLGAERRRRAPDHPCGLLLPRVHDSGRSCGLPEERSRLPYVPPVLRDVGPARSFSSRRGPPSRLFSSLRVASPYPSKHSRHWSWPYALPFRA